MDDSTVMVQFLIRDPELRIIFELYMPEKKYVDEETFYKLVTVVDGNRVELEKLRQEVARLKAALSASEKADERGKQIG